MSKSNKIIAGLGVAAALGMAALPFGAFATDAIVTLDSTDTISGDVTVKYLIPEYISMRIDDGVVARGGTSANEFSPELPETDGKNARTINASENAPTGDPATNPTIQKTLPTSPFDALYGGDHVNITAGSSNVQYNSTIFIGTNATKGYTLTATPGNTGDSHDADLWNGQTGVIAPFNGDATYTSGSFDKVGWGLKIAAADDKHTQSQASATDIKPSAMGGTYAADTYYSDFDYDNTTDEKVGKFRGFAANAAAKTVLRTGTLSNAVIDRAVINYGVKANDAQPAGTYQNTITYTSHVND